MSSMLAARLAVVPRGAFGAAGRFSDVSSTRHYVTALHLSGVSPIPWTSGDALVGASAVSTARPYSSTTVLQKTKKRFKRVKISKYNPERNPYPKVMRKKWDPKEHGWDDFPHGEIQTLNAPPDMTEAEMIQIMEEGLAKMEEEKKKQFVPNWKPGMRKRPLMISYNQEDFEYEYNPEVTPRWTFLDKRCGALAIKVGMIPYWDDWGEYHCCTILYVDTNVVIGHKTEAKHGYIAAVLGGGERKLKNVKHTIRGQYKNLIDHAPYLLKEFPVTDEANLPPIGSYIHARHFTPGQAVDIVGISKGKGFQGGMKRHGFSGQPASHGNSLSHRAIGAVGARKPGKVFKGKKMPGRMGCDRKTIQNIRILKIDRGRNLLYVKGCVPGNRGHFVEVKDAHKRPLWGTKKVLGELDRPPLPTFEYDPAIDGTDEKGHEEVMPLSEIDPMIPPEIIPPPPGKH